MICSKCREGKHRKCKQSGCCCQHRVLQPQEPATGAPGE